MRLAFYFDPHNELLRRDGMSRRHEDRGFVMKAVL